MGCYAPRLWMMVTCVDGQVCSNFHGTVQCYGQMLHSNFLHLVTFVINSTWYTMQFATVLHYMSVHTLTILYQASIVYSFSFQGKLQRQHSFYNFDLVFLETTVFSFLNFKLL